MNSAANAILNDHKQIFAQVDPYEFLCVHVVDSAYLFVDSKCTEILNRKKIIMSSKIHPAYSNIDHLKTKKKHDDLWRFQILSEHHTMRYIVHVFIFERKQIGNCWNLFNI